MYNMKDGIRAWEDGTAVGPPEMGLFVFRGDESPVETAALAYGLEEGLRRFYQLLADRSEDSEAADLFLKLAGYEAKHKDKIFELYSSLTPAPQDRKSLEDHVASDIMEGGWNVEVFMDEHQGHFTDIAQVLELALTVETQALDLYLRFTQKSVDEKTAEIIHRIAAEEKIHMARLDRLMGRRI